MDAKQAITEIMRIEGVSAPELSTRMGKSKCYANSMLSKGTSFTLTTLARMAGALGYEVEVVIRSKDGLAFHAEVPLD